MGEEAGVRRQGVGGLAVWTLPLEFLGIYPRVIKIERRFLRDSFKGDLNSSARKSEFLGIRPKVI